MARQVEAGGDSAAAFKHLERAHVLGQASTVEHVRVHIQMLLWALRHHHLREAAGQVLRIVGAATKTSVGLVPSENTGGTNISPFQSLPMPQDLAALIEAASQRPTQNR